MGRKIIDDLASIIRKHQKTLPNVEKLDVDDEFRQVFKETEDGNLTIENDMYICTGLRKVHMEIASLGPLDILHCIWYPDPEFDLPIFGADIVANNRMVSAAITDISQSMVSVIKFMMISLILVDTTVSSTIETCLYGVTSSLHIVSLPD
jgi:hypothetical protein